MSEINKRRIEELRIEMKKEGMDFYIVPTDDYHISEYVGDFFKCRRFLSGFTGSAGTLIVSLESAYLWVDGRYFIQAKKEIIGSDVVLMMMGEKGVPDIPDFLYNYAKNSVIGYDGKTMSLAFSKSIKNRLEGCNVKYITSIDLVDRVWVDRPSISKEKIHILPEKYSGRSVSSKLEFVRNSLKEKGLDGAIFSSLDEIAWLYNYRGGDVLYTPVALAYSVVTLSSQTLYIAKEAISISDLVYFEKNDIKVKEYFDIYNEVSALEGKILVDPNSTNELLYSMINNPVLDMSMVKEEKAIKNEIEINNEKLAHIKDGVALTKTIYWIKKLAKEGKIHNETELSIAEHLTNLRKENENFVSLSFENIVATAEHSPICHYDPTPETDKHIEDGFLLMDTGGHYLEGSTDVTRTVSIGEIDRRMKLHYTAVLKGHIDLSLAIFPNGTLGNSLDVLARKPIWDLGLDFNHGTGHGVGYLLGVHEGPQNIRRQSYKGPMSYPLKEGMITSDEPGIYIENEYGIRIENLFLTKKVGIPGYEDFLTFEMLTLCPYDKDSINFFDLNEAEIKYLRNYNEKLVKELGPYLSEEELDWLIEETKF